MSNYIAQTRTEVGLTLRALAERLGVTPGAVHQYETSEQLGTIRVSTLHRVLNAMGFDYLPQVSPIRAPLRREERINLEVHREVAKNLLEDPAHVIAIARENIPKVRGNIYGARPNSLLDQWISLLDGPIGPLIAQLLDESRHGIEMRQNSPFAGAIEQSQRLDAIARVPR